MKKIIGFILLIISTHTFSQKIFSDRRDSINDTRTVLTDNLKLYDHGTLQISGMVQITHGSPTYSFTFLTPSKKVDVTAETEKSNCQIKTTTGKTIEGSWLNNSTMPIGTKTYDAVTFNFSKPDFETLATSKTKTIKFVAGTKGGLFEIKGKYQNTVSKICRLLLDIN